MSARTSTHALRHAVEFFGPERTLFGADYPFGPDEGRFWLERTVDLLTTMDLPASTRERVFGGNLARLIER